MARTRFAPDRGLSARMGLTMFLLGLVLVVFVVAMVLLAGRFPANAGAIVIIAVLIAGGMTIGSLFYSDKIALRAARARLVSPQDSLEAAELHGVVDRLCALADMPKPRVAISDTDMPNAFATGRNTNSAVLCVTTGLLRRLDRSELEGVISHEMSHVAHKDVVVMTIASFLAIVAGLMVRFAFYGELFGGGRGRRDSSNQSAAFVMLAIMAVSVVVYAVSFLLIRALSRYRELAADRSGALLTGQPSALASALQKVSGAMARIPTKDLRSAESLNAFYFVPAFTKGSISGLFSTHPPLEKRLAQLAKISQQIGR
jgi:heat shock protein HtpX